MNFYNRTVELDELKSLSKISKKHKVMIVLTGRRRVGKTELIKKHLKSHKGIYLFVNPKKTEAQLVTEFFEIIKENEDVAPYIEIKNLENLFKLIFDMTKEKNITIAIDEFQRIKSINESAIYSLQKIWDEGNARLLLILSGSSVGMIKEIFIKDHAPLFKRSHNILDMEPFPFKTVNRILVDLGVRTLEERIKLFCVFGGIPIYYTYLEDYGIKSLDDAINSLLLRPKAPLRNEVREIIIEEFGKELTTHYSILSALALGKNTLNEIAGYVGIKETSLMPYIYDLSNILGIVNKTIPVMEKTPLKSKKGVYELSDNFFKFWFRFIFRHYNYYEQGDYDFLKRLVNKYMNDFLGQSFERLCIEILRTNKKLTPFSFTKIGRQWGKIPRAMKGKNIYEIDIVALNEDTKEILFAECKWKDKVNAKDVLTKLKEKPKFVKWNNEDRKEHYAIFAKSFKSKDVEGVKLYDLKDLEKMFE